MTTALQLQPQPRQHGTVSATGRVYTVGYEGMTLTGLIERMAQSHVTVVVDVRLNPVSRKPGFSKRSLAQALEAAGIGYVHEPELGNPPDNRDSLRSGDPKARQLVADMLSNGSGRALLRVAARARAGRIAILCVERDQYRCHRSVITDTLLELEPQLRVVPVP
jgi:uncharacterized protein (DUF488 family)